MLPMRHVKAALSKFRHVLSDWRISTREPFDSPAEVIWRDIRGRINHDRARCIDISDSGARIAYREPIEVPALMQVRPESDGVLRTGHVRHCTVKGGQYEIGIEFIDPALHSR